MPIIRIDYDNAKVEEKDVLALSSAVRNIVAEVTDIDDVFVYGNSSQIKVKIAPVEIFIEMSAHKIIDQDVLMGAVKSRLAQWKQEHRFPHLINLTLIPMQWKIEIGI